MDPKHSPARPCLCVILPLCAIWSVVVVVRRTLCRSVVRSFSDWGGEVIRTNQEVSLYLLHGRGCNIKFLRPPHSGWRVCVATMS